MQIYKDKTKSTDERVKDLMSLMTLEEKVDQLHLFTDRKALCKEVKEGKIPKRFFGAVFNLDSTDKKMTNKIQSLAINNSRLGIPILFIGEGIHGLFFENGTKFPQNIGMGCSFNPELLEKEAVAIAKESYTQGFRQIFAPNVDVARELRWGRVQETYGEDTYLVGEMGAAYVRGLQSQGVAATLKHFIAYPFMENGINLSSVHLGERDVREELLPPFERCIKEGAKSLMVSYNSLDGEPLHISKKWVTDILRGELGFKGEVVSDWNGVDQLNFYHMVASTNEKAGLMALKAGIDAEYPDAFGLTDKFCEDVAAGNIDEALIDNAVYNVLKLKFDLGLFDGNAYCTDGRINLKESVKLARKCAEQSIVMLKNDGVLPLSKDKKIALIGPVGKQTPFGCYSYPVARPNDKSLYDGLAEHLGEGNFLCAMGSSAVYSNEELLAEAIEAAKQADVIIMAMGDESKYKGNWNGKEIVDPTMNGENYDLHDITLPDAQKQLFAEIEKLGKPIVSVIYTGRPNVIVNEYEKSSALLQAWYPGEQGGLAIADILYGKVNPTGKLCISFPRSVGHLPCNYNHRKSARGNFWKMAGSLEKPGKDYVFSSPKAFLPFGFGLGYIPISYLSVKAKKLDDLKAEVSVKIRNDGNAATEESVLVFISADYNDGGIVPFEKLLKAFKRVKINAGQTKTVKFILEKDAFSYIDTNMKKAYNAGQYVISSGSCECRITV